jgi:cytochrome c biogenesis protein CcmG/thiol:disulfide interchange protein DsbE
MKKIFKSKEFIIIICALAVCTAAAGIGIHYRNTVAASKGSINVTVTSVKKKADTKTGSKTAGSKTTGSKTTSGVSVSSGTETSKAGSGSTTAKAAAKATTSKSPVTTKAANANAAVNTPTTAATTAAPLRWGNAPDFTIDDVNGNSFTLSSEIGHPIVMIVWITTCSICEYELQYAQSVYNKYSSQGLEVIGVCEYQSNSASDAKSKAASLGLTYKILFDMWQVPRMYGMYEPGTTNMYTSWMVFIDRQGNIYKKLCNNPYSQTAGAQFLYESDIETYVKAIL